MARYDLPIVMLHTVNDAPQEHPLGFLTFSSRQFRAFLRFFQRDGYRTIFFSELPALIAAGALGREKLVLLTFDDGFLDNALIALPILQEFGMKATIFANPGYAGAGPARTLADVPNAWGYLNVAELRALQQSGVFDVQSHTMTHDFIFTDDTIVDLYTPDKFDQYHWLCWMLHPPCAREWHGDVRRFASRIPTGYPIFTYDRCLAGRQFIPDPAFVARCLENAQRAHSRPLEALRDMPAGDYESQEAYEGRVREQLAGSRAVLASTLGTTIDTVCFPGGCYNPLVLAQAEEAGYRYYMRASRDRSGMNVPALSAAPLPPLVGLRRLSFTHDYPQALPASLAAYWLAKISISAYQGDAWFRGGKQMLRAARRLLAAGRARAH
ncbi:MAG TPA: polysaccharide deacetylase family protein [Armatimonadota bacterium]|nr:polysaccharide deacetylase family protein [Armatimonadota bacterium]HOS42563.1 polysaccharide deacetylase family protein [Armatimonadota bacterium]